MSDRILTAKDLCKSFAHNGGQVHVLQHIDLEIKEKDFTVVMGASGSGKSTLLYALSGMDKATSGQVLFDGKDLVKMKEKELADHRSHDFGFIFQQMHLVSNLTLLENVTVPGYLSHRKSASEVKKRAQELLAKMGVSDVMDHRPSQVSGGEQQRCAIARSIIHEPKLLFADEPTGALNRKNTTEVLDLMTELNRQGQSILMVTHDLRAALRGNRLLYLEDGNVIGELSLPPSQKEDEKSRQTQVNAWLSSMKW